jgi:hypothetical protein
MDLDTHAELGIVGSQLRAAERSLNTLSSRALTLVRGRFGADSDAYERVGGVRQSERKRTPRRPAGGGGVGLPPLLDSFCNRFPGARFGWL